ncbi:ubiA prenyltransferase domain-containing protein 1-like [Lineus longissimus]|uniref:ubiA prenyltransferase domain-containing protein 1-like n=1 Tax=Lineus longissimus TaxID=88925 RepID=UPI00315C73F6
MENDNNGVVKNQKGINGSPIKDSTPLARLGLASRLRPYVVALRPWSFSASLTPVALGSVLAYKVNGDFSIVILLLTCFTALSVHAAGNLVNTFCDYYKGVDSKKSDDRTLVDHLLMPNDVAYLGGVFYAAGCFGFLLTNWLSTTSMEHLALIYFGGLSSSFLYTGGLGLKYIALGDIVILLTFGPITVLFSFLTQGGVLSFLPLLYAVPLALNTEAILHSNNARDMECDKSAGIVTLAILLGRTGSYVLFVVLLFTPYVMFAVLGINFSKWFLLPVLTIFLAFDNEREFRGGKLRFMPHNIAKLNLVMGFLYVFAVFMVDSTRMPGLP